MTQTSARRPQKAAVDAITFSLMLSRLTSIAVEMTITLEHAAMTSILALVRDYSCCIFNARTQLLAMVDAIPIHTNSMSLVLTSICEAYGDDIHEGDVILCNDPYHNNSHIGDLVTVCPVFYNGTLVFWAGAKGHQLDVGAPIPHSANPFARDVWQEGLTIPPVKLYERGVLRDDLKGLYLANVRWRDQLEGDLMAQLGSIWKGEQRLHELCARYEPDVLSEYCDEIIKYADDRMCAEIRSMPVGTFFGQTWLDATGGSERDLEITCSVTIGTDNVGVAFAGPPEVASGTNASLAVMKAAGGIPLLMTIDPDIPHNEGCLGRIEVQGPVGTLCNARFPAATAASTVLPADAMQDAVAKALASAMPDRLYAGNSRWSNVPMFSGVDPRDGRPWGHQVGNCGGGGGASKGADGWPLITTSAAFGGLKIASVEHTEQLYPLMVDKWELEPESMGCGEFIGGPGVRCSVHGTADKIEVIGISDGLRNPPYGVLGGTPGAGGGAYIQYPDGHRDYLGAAIHHTLRAGESWTGVSSGGGGYGDPFCRLPDAVREDVRNGIYGLAFARDVFGVVLIDDGSYSIDLLLTEALRASAATISPPAAERVSPNGPSHSDWVERALRHNDAWLEGRTGDAPA